MSRSYAATLALPRAARAALTQAAVVGLLLIPSLAAYLLADLALPPEVGAARALVVAALIVAAGFVFPPLRAAAFIRIDRALRPAEHAGSRHALTAAIREIATLLDRRTLTTTLARRLDEALQVDGVSLWTRDPGVSLYRRRDGAAELQITGDEARHLDAWITDTAAGAWTAEILGRGRLAAVAPRLGGTLWLPLCTKGGPLGVLVLGGRRAGRAYSEDQLELLAVLANQVAVVLENASLYEQLVASNNKLTESKRLLQQASRLSTVGTIAAGLAHEIRNPLAAVQTFLQILPERLSDPEVTVEFRNVALAEMERVSKLIGELLGMARTPALKFEPTSLDEVVDQVVRLLRVAAERKRVEIRRVGEALPVGYADAARLKQALLNVILNAVQATEPGTAVTVRTRTEVTSAGRRLAEVAVLDHGPGIAAAQLDSIFEPFATTKESGTGLGLAVTQQIVADHGGRIHVESDEGHGATFVVEVPIEERTPADLH